LIRSSHWAIPKKRPNSTQLLLTDVRQVCCFAA
jgi:hypothetical protein